MKKIAEIFTEVKDSWLMDVRNLTDEQLMYDRNKWMKDHGRQSKDSKYYRSEDERSSDVHTIAILIEQLRRKDKIHYEV
tara:strand:- start:398 stop:634 length:237 start_codon:yes stop_codon:yes gene_type:complete